jgi:ATP-binding cassette subfamily B protein
MADQTAYKYVFAQPIRRIYQVIKLEKNEISSIYFYTIISGLIQLSLPIGIQSIISFVLGGAMSASLIFLIVLVVLGVFLGGLLQVNQMKLIEKIEQKLFVRYSLEFSDRIPRFNLQHTGGKHLPELVNRFFDAASLQKGVSKLLLEIPAATIQIFFGLILLCFYHSVFIFFGVTLIAIIYLILRTTSTKGMESSLYESDYKYKVAGWLEEMARVVNSFKFSRSRSLAIERTDHLVTGYLKNRTNHFKVLLKQYWTLIAFKIIITASMLIVGSILLVDQQLNIGQFIAAEIVILMVIGSVEKLITNLDNVYDVLTSVEKLGKVTDMPLEGNGSVDLPHESTGLNVEATNLTFSYSDDSGNKALNDITFQAKSGEKICLMGRAGSGKSTIIKILSGAFREFEGSVTINNLSIHNYELYSLRTQIGVLFSHQDIFEGTLMENITMGAKDISIQHILQLAEKVGLKSYIANLPEGFDTKLDPAGTKLSNKVIQKILLLRGMLSHPRLLLLENPFEGLEDNVKASVVDYLFTGLSASTAFVCSNDISFASKCDKVIYLDQGTILAMGKWDEVQSKISFND